MPRRVLAVAAITALTVVIAATGTALGAQRYASPTGTAASTSGCIQSNPCDLLGSIDTAQAGTGDEVILAPGTYNVATQVYIANQLNVHGTGKPAATRIVSSVGGGFAFAIATGAAVLSDVQIESPTSLAVVNVAYGSLRRVISINTLNGSGCAAYYGTISDSVCLGADYAGAAGFLLSVNSPSDNPSVKLRNITAISRSATGNGIAVSATGGAVAAVDAKSVIARGGAIDVSATVTGAGSAAVVLDHSNFATPAGVGGGTVTSPSANNNQSATPVFVDAANADYREAAGSPTIDAGATDLSSGATDLDGNARVLGAAADIGAFEYVMPVTPPPPAGPAPDTTAPKIKVSKKPRSRTTSKKATFRFSANEPATFTCKLDKGRTRSCKSPRSIKVKLGSHKLKITAKDAAGNTSSTTVRWKVVRK